MPQFNPPINRPDIIELPIPGFVPLRGESEPFPGSQPGLLGPMPGLSIGCQTEPEIVDSLIDYQSIDLVSKAAKFAKTDF
jgi:hypothetical protein